MIKNNKTLILLFLYIVTINNYAQKNTVYFIPKQTINLYKEIGDTSKKIEHTVRAFEISSFITYKEYKLYLESIKKDSSMSFYKKQLPDLGILFKKEYQHYLTSTLYDEYPVVGISWESAMFFFKWKTLKDNKKDSITFVYRLPNCSEWIAANYYLKSYKIANDLNQNFSDWTINTFDESSYDFSEKDKYFAYDDLYFTRDKKESRVLTRKRVIGNSYLHQHENIYLFFYNYSAEGKRDLGFRYIKDYLDDSNYKEIIGEKLAKSILRQWGIIK